MDVKSEPTLLGDRSALVARDPASRRGSEVTQRIPPARQSTEKAETLPDSQVVDAGGVDARVQRLAVAMAQREASASKASPENSAAADAQAQLTQTQIRSAEGQAWSAQANISTHAALALLRD